MALNIWIFAVLTLITLAYYLLKKQFNYWSDRGVPFIEASIPFGTLKGVGTKICNAEMIRRSYNELKGKAPLGGIFFFTNPVAMITDLDLLKRVLVKDFSYFQDRGFLMNEKDDPLTLNLLSLTGDQWRQSRNKLSPTFTSGRLKAMFPTILTVADRLRNKLVGVIGDNQMEVELRDLMARYTTDVIAKIGFGINVDSLADPKDAFRVAGRSVFEFDFYERMRFIFTLVFPDLSRKLRMKSINENSRKFFMKVITETVEYREKNNIKLNDFMSLLIQIKNTGKLDGDKEAVGNMSFNELASHVALFFTAGFETSSSTMTYVLYELALNLEIQKKAREELNEVMERHSGEMSYEAVTEMHYLDQIINETLRKHSIVESLTRKVVKPYKVPEMDVILEEGTTVVIPVHGIHHDEEFYPEPDKFDPERFTKESIAARPAYTWLPFGDGPRNCVGMRLGLLQAKIGLAVLLRNFEISPSRNTPIPLKYQPAGIFLLPDGDMPFNVKRVANVI